MRCFCCDIEVSEDGHDQKTDRWYCFPCFEATNEVLLNKELNDLRRGDAYGEDVLELEFLGSVEPDFEEVVSTGDLFGKEDEWVS